MKQFSRYEASMPLGKGEQMFVTKDWAATLDKFIDEQPGSYLTNLAGVLGCTRSTITKLRKAQISVSRWVEPLCKVTGLDTPVQEVGSKDVEIISLLGKIRANQKDIILALIESMSQEDE